MSALGFGGPPLDALLRTFDDDVELLTSPVYLSLTAPVVARFDAIARCRSAYSREPMLAPMLPKIAG